MDAELIRKYNVAGPRYTSYPTVPYWDRSPKEAEWMTLMRDSFTVSNQDGISLYIHLPFCESLCTYCGCNTRITVNHAVETPYINTLLKEWKMYLRQFPSLPRIKEIHLGGGTPTFFSSANLRRLMDGIFEGAERADNFEFGFEGHPNYTSVGQLQSLYELGFRRVSYGVQDFDPRVQYIIHREQSVEQVEKVTLAARSIGYTSVNYDLIYGLPLQTREGMIDTIGHVTRLLPDRIAFYSYAHVPWIKPGQRKFTEDDLPSANEKRMLYETGRHMLEEKGYVEIGMDHFALKTDSLYKAAVSSGLHRNFMGYTTSSTRLLIGLGVSSIGDSWTGFAQNVKVFETYVQMVEAGKLPLLKGHILTKEDLVLRRHILNLMCRFETRWSEEEIEPDLARKILERLSEVENDGLIEIHGNSILVKEKGRPFLRNICMAFDARLWRKQPESLIFSQTV
jgi:oxygen-independent coproporphyrinogen-3 oxidase